MSSVNGSASIVGYIRKAAARRNLTAGEMRYAVGAIADGSVTPAQVAAFLMALALKGETADELAGAASAMRAHAVGVRSSRKPIVDVCGTGGDCSGTFNVSTAVALVVAGAGVPVAKHGNRAMSSSCGSADVLAELGVRLDPGPETSARMLDEHGIAFLFAQAHHPSMRFVAAIRQQIGVRTLFNMLGPLTNPAGAHRQIVGVALEQALAPVAEALGRLGCERAAAVRGSDGLDELTLAGPSRVAEWTGEQLIEYDLDPRDFGFSIRPSRTLSGGSASENARIIRDILAGQSGPRRDVVVFNAGLALHIAGAAPDVGAGCAFAARSIDSKAAAAKLEALVKASNA